MPERIVTRMDTYGMNEYAPALDLRVEKRRISRVALGFFVMLIVTTLVQSIIAAVVMLAAPQAAEQDWYVWVLSLAPMYLVGAPLCLLIVHRTSVSPVEKKTMSIGAFLVALVMCFGIMYPLNLLSTLLNTLLGGLLNASASNPLEMIVTTGGPLYTLIFGAILAPILEELVFRGLIISRMRRYGDGFAIMFSALIFGLFHGNLYQFFYAFGLGLFFGFIYARTGRLAYTIGLHVLVNFFGSVVSVFVLERVDVEAIASIDTTAILSGDPAALEQIMAMAPSLALYGMFSLLIFGLTIAGIVLLIVKRRRFTVSAGPVTLPKGYVVKTGYLNVGFILFAVLCIALMAVTLFAV